ncbi:hypothetical protein Cgig2_016111 [Carnegiea gigantea]|uniref:Pentatricopeptide repeat-containing protein n=1 Tax=Carnegiea gigantea TaxID=171969 RepID=A0A9Q1KLR0_9CARY|nr:hypothetical protein Cgig2_016111 [Carnegiea gigantea]
MWRSIASRSCITRHLGRKLHSFQNPPSTSQVLHNTLNSSSCTSFFTNPRRLLHQNQRFFSHSSMSEFETEAHDATSSSEELELESGGGFSDETHISIDQELDGVNEGPVSGIDVGKLEVVLSLLQSSVDESLESRLDSMDLGLNEEFVVRVLQTPLVHGEHLIRFFKWALDKKEFSVTSSVLGSLASAICNNPKRKDAYALWDLVKGIYEKEKGVVDAETLNQLISAFAKMGKRKAAFEVFGKFEELGCVPNADTYYLTIEALCKRSFYEWAMLACQKMLDEGMLPESEKVGKIISLFCKEKKDNEGAKSLLLEMIEKGPPPGNAIFNSVINCLSKSRDLEDAKEMLKLMESRGLKPDVDSYNVIMSGYAKGGSMEQACKLLWEAKQKHQKLCPVTFHTLIRGYCKLGEFDEALKLLSEVKDYGVEANVDEYNKLIQTLCLKALDWETSEKLLEEMKVKGLHLPGITRGLIRAVKELEQEAVTS